MRYRQSRRTPGRGGEIQAVAPHNKELRSYFDTLVEQTGQQFTHEHVVRCFHDCDVDASGAVAFNELLRYRRQGAL